MTYLEFLGYFIGIPLLGSIFWALRKQSLNGTRILGIALICLIALVYTTPWDNYLIRQGVWSYPEGVVLGTIGYVPIEEYGFMMLQSMLGGILWSLTHRKDSQSSLSFSIKGVLPALIIGMIGVYFLSQRSGTYAGLIFGLGLSTIGGSMGIWFKGFMVIDKELGSTVGDVYPLSLLCRCLCDLRGNLDNHSGDKKRFGNRQSTI